MVEICRMCLMKKWTSLISITSVHSKEFNFHRHRSCTGLALASGCKIMLQFTTPQNFLEAVDCCSVAIILIAFLHAIGLAFSLIGLHQFRITHNTVYTCRLCVSFRDRNSWSFITSQLMSWVISTLYSFPLTAKIMDINYISFHLPSELDTPVRGGHVGVDFQLLQIQ